MTLALDDDEPDNDSRRKKDFFLGAILGTGTWTTGGSWSLDEGFEAGSPFIVPRGDLGDG